MAKHHIFAVLAAFLLASTLSAANVALGPEVPLSRDLQPTPIGADAIAAASNGSDFLLVWQDSRSGFPAVRAVRVDSAGHPVASVRPFMGAGSNPQVAPAGAGYLIVWQATPGIMSVRVDANGMAMGSPQTLIPNGSVPVALLANGSSFLLVYNSGYGLALLNSAGALSMNLGNAIGAGFMGATARGNRYVVAATPPEGGPGRLYTVNEDGTTSHSAPFPVSNVARAAFGATTVLAVTNTTYTIVDYDGTVIKPATLLPASGPPRNIAAAWDGHQFLAVVSGHNAFRITMVGTLVDTTPFALSPNAVTQFTFAPGAVNGLTVWTDESPTRALVGRAVADFDALAASSVSPPGNLVLAVAPQIDPQLALAGSRTCAVWSDAGHYEVSAAFDGGAPITLQSATGINDWIGWPSVAAGNGVFLIAWRHKVTGGNDRVLAMRFTFDGSALDTAPIVVDTAADNDYLIQLDTAPAIAFDGSAFFLAWGRGASQPNPRPTLYTARMDETGQLRDRRDTVTSSFGIVDRSAKVLWTGSEFVVVHVVHRAANCNICPDYGSVEMLRFNSASSAISQAATPEFAGGGILLAGATLSPDGVTYAWVDAQGSIEVAQTRVDGTMLQVPSAVIKRTDLQSYTDIAWDGSHYVLVWLDAFEPGYNTPRVLRGIRLDRNLQPVDPAPFDVFSVPGPYSPPRVIPSPTGVLIVYTRSDDQSDGSSRAFARGLDAFPAPPAPDLIVTAGISLTPGTVRVGDAVSVNYQIKNQGNAAAGASTTHIEFKRYPDGALVFAQDYPTIALAAGEVTNEGRTVPIPISLAAGVYIVAVTVDHGGVLGQSYKANDTASASLTVVGASPVCTFAFDPAEVTVPAAGGSASVKVVARDATCSWSVTSHDAWLTLSSAAGTGSGTIAFTVSPNPKATARTTTISLGDATVTIHQPGANVRRRTTN